MKRGIISIMVAVICGFSFCVPSARATLITIEITAEVDFVRDEGNYLEGRIRPGDIITGTYTYDSDTPDSSPSDPIVGHYYHYNPPAGISLTVGGFDFATDPTNVDFHVLIVNNNQSGDDIYGIGSYNNLPLSNGTLVDYILWSLKDHTASVLSSDALPAAPPLLHQWQANVFRLEGDRAFYIDAHVTSAIPEPATRLVPDDYATIQAAVDDCNDGDMVIVATGRYYENIHFNGKNITLRSTDSNNPDAVAATIIDGGQNGSVVTFNSGEDANCVLNGFTITNGAALCGGAIYCRESGPIINNCIITRNSAEGYGGGIFCFSPNPTISPKITNCTIKNNIGSGISFHEGHPIITNCIISENSRSGIDIRLGNATVTNCIITNNEGYEGGGLHCDGYKYGGTFIISDCIITQNNAEYGAGIYFSYANNAMVTNCTIIGNSAAREGGGIYCSESYPSVANCIISGNLARGGGGAVYSRYGRAHNHPRISNCTIVGNTSPAISAYRSKSIITNSIIYYNRSYRYHPWGGIIDIVQIDDGSATVTYSNVQGGWPGEGNIDADPCFVEPGYWDANSTPVPPPPVPPSPDPPPSPGPPPPGPPCCWIDGDYHLLADSPCINVGDPNHPYDPNETDLDGRPRIIGGRIDMGAYEYRPPIPAEARIVPRTINLASKGKSITCYIWLPEDYNVADIDTNSVFLEDEIQAQSLKLDEEQQVAMARFNRSDVQGILEVGEMELTVTGQLLDGTVFEGTDTIKVIDKGRRKD